MNKDKTIEKGAGFTPGPWKVANYNYIRGTIFSVAVAIDLPGQDEKEKQANARLIASAPELYAQCKLFERMLASGDLSATHDGLTNCNMLARLREILANVDGGDE